MSTGPAVDAVKPAGAGSDPTGGRPTHTSLLSLDDGLTADNPTFLDQISRTAWGRWALHLIPYLWVGQTWGLLWWGLTFLFNPSLNRPNLSELSAIPGRMVVFHLLIVACGFVPRAARLWVLSAAGLAAGIGFRLIDPGSAVLFLLVCAAVLPWLRLKVVPRWLRLGSVFLVVAATRIAAQALGFDTLGRPDIAVGFAVCLWYACYAASGNRSYGLTRHLGYMQVRLFTEGPVFPPDDLGPVRPNSLLVPAIRALSIAMLARTVAFHLHAALEVAVWKQTTGAPLLGFSYLNYVALSCDLVFAYNMVVGLLRLAGLPIRDNFGAWFLACTPNDHWRRWNLLYREWILTFTFYPLMRARRGLFACVMSALLASGLVHLFAHVGEPVGIQKIALTVLYWTINGLAIYAVLTIPRRIPQAIVWLRLGTSRIWMVAGWLATSSFYAVLFFVNQECETFSEAAAYLGRLVGAS